MLHPENPFCAPLPYPSLIGEDRSNISNNSLNPIAVLLTDALELPLLVRKVRTISLRLSS